MAWVAGAGAGAGMGAAAGLAMGGLWATIGMLGVV